MASIRHGFREDGWLVSQALLVWATDEIATPRNLIIDGEHRWIAARDVGLHEGPMVLLHGLTEREAKALTIKLDQKRGTWRSDADLGRVLADLAAEGEILPVDFGFESGEIDSLIAAATSAGELEITTDEAPPEATDEDEEPERFVSLADPITKPGDLWILGDHKIACVDTFHEEQRRALLEDALVDLVLTDPPFAIYGSSTGIAADIADDKMVRPFFEKLARICGEHVRMFAHVYVCCDWRSYAALWDGARRGGLTPKNCIVWDKLSCGLGSSYANTHEFVAFFAALPKERIMKRSSRVGQRQVHKLNLVRYPRVSGHERKHNAAKPVVLFAELIENSSDAGELVFDPFLGSGTTVIACEKTGRRCIGIDVEPKWCDVSVRRWEELTGRKAERRAGAIPVDPPS
jgi:DNA modification methylase